MAKIRSVYFCQNCGQESAKWAVKCPACTQWNTFVEEQVVKTPSRSLSNGKLHPDPISIQSIERPNEVRIPLTDPELNRVLGGGIVPGSMVLLGGEPGIGKSTLMLQVALRATNLRTLYVSGEESAAQLKMRADRIGITNSDMQVLTETVSEHLISQFKKVKPDLIIIDSIQTVGSQAVESAPGSVSQVRESAAQFLRFAKETNTPIVLIGHINKDGMIAGPKVLEHMVDTVLQFEGDRNHLFRMVRAIKNRFGVTPELAIYEMRNDGLDPVTDPSRVLCSGESNDLSGVALSITVEGARPMLIETQALVSSAVYGTPQRSTTGFDLRRLNMLLAVLEKRCGFRLGGKDVFLNIAGGMRLDDPAIDLGVCCAILSSSEDMSIPRDTCFSGEVGLSGEVRQVARLEQRIKEAAGLGMKRMIVPKGVENIAPSDMQLVEVSSISDAFKLLFG
jgi:DNA repair protein RadA/Sms